METEKVSLDSFALVWPDKTDYVKPLWSVNPRVASRLDKFNVTVPKDTMELIHTSPKKQVKLFMTKWLPIEADAPLGMVTEKLPSLKRLKA